MEQARQGKQALVTVSGGEKLAYGLGALGMNLIFNTMSTYLMIFYTDVFGVTASVVGTLFLVARVWDAVNDPVMGIVADRTRTRFGKYRPYILFMPMVVAVTVVMCFSAPGLSATWKIVYIYVTYIAFGMAFTAYDIPYWAIAPTLTQDVNERTKVVALPRMFGTVGTLLAGVAVIPMVKAFGGGNDARGYQLAAIVLVSLSVLLNIVTFAKVRERVSVASKKHEPLSVSLRVIISNKPLLLVLASGLLSLIPLFVKFTMATYYFKYNAGNENLTPLFLLTTSVVMIIGMILVQGLSHKLGKRNTFLLAGVLSVVGNVLMYLVGDGALPAFLLFNGIAALGFGFTMVLASSMMADTVEYAQLETGKRSESIIYSAGSFNTKLAMALAGAIAGFGMTGIGYVANTIQTPLALTGIRMGMSLVPAVGALLSLIPIWFYDLTEERHAEILRTLASRSTEA